ncbi:MAG: sulfotransferase family 2 domain-containing protein [Cyanobacteria bacterium J06634_6]
MALADRELTQLNKPKKSWTETMSVRSRTLKSKLELRLYRLSGGKIANFLHIPKTGGSAVKSALENVSQTSSHRIHLRGHSCRLKDIPVGDQFFFFLRDPAKRFVSAFNHKKTGRGYWKHNKVEAETAALKRFDTANQLAEAIFSTDEATRLAAESAMVSIEHVNTFYADWFVSKDYFESRFSDCLLIGFQETLATDFERLKQLLNLPETLALPERNSGKANENPVHLETSLSPTAQENLSKWYAKDYDFLAFCKEKAREQESSSLSS